MGNATFAVSSFLGGEISGYAQGRFDKPDYRISLNVCLNAFPAEIGPWMRRPGTAYASHTRAGAPGKVVKFDVQQAAPFTLEFTDGYVRFRAGTGLIASSTPQTVVAVSTANPAVVQTAAAVTWATGNTLVFSNPSTPLLENRQFLATKVDTTHFSLADALTGAAIDGSTLGALSAGATVAKVHERTTPYIGGTWANLRAVQAETTDVLLCPGIAPQALVATLTPGAPPAFVLSPATFNDGPYLDPFTNGVQATPSALSGVIGITLAFPAYSATVAYAAGSFVTSSSVNYISLVDQNVGNTPASSPTFWAVTSASAAINEGKGFLGTDIGRSVRLFSEPPAWLIGSTYAAKAVVSYNPSGQFGQTTYWQSLTSSNTGNAPGADLTNWQIIPQGAAIWSWGKITSLTNIISPSLSGSASIGDMTAGGGLAAAFDGVFAQASAASAEKITTGGGLDPGQTASLTSYVGKNYSGASNQIIQSAAIYPSSDGGFAIGTGTGPESPPAPFSISVVFNLRGKASLPSSSSDGTLLGTSGSVPNGFSAITITSSDQTTAWAYVWVEQITTAVTLSGGTGSYSLANAVAELSFFNPPGSGVSSGVAVEILGPPLLYTAPVVTWRLGAYSNTTGWPTCGCYDDGRLWLGGAIDNRFDTSTSNGIVPGSSVVNFAPTDQYGVVSANSAISETLNSDSANPIFAMIPDLQGVLMLTQAGEFLVLAPTSGSIAPNNITSRRGTNIGSENVEPIRTDHTILFVRRFGRKLIEYFADVFSGKFSGPNLVERAEHIVRTGIAEIRYTDAVTPIAWGRCNDGSWFGATYKRDALTTSQGPTYAAFHRQSLGSGRTVQSICSGPSVDGELDALTMVTNDPTTGIHHVEVMTDTMGELSTLTDAWFLDDAVTPSSTSSSVAAITGAPYGGLTINGLWHLNGKTVQVYASGLDCGDPGEGNPFRDFLVTNGSCLVPYGDGISAGSGRGLFTPAFASTAKIVVGFTYNSDGQLVRPILPQDTGARSGPSLGLLRRLHRYALLLSNTAGISVGTSFAGDLDPVPLKQADGETDIPALTTFSGVAQAAIEDSDSYDGMLCWRVSRPYPATVVAVSANLAAKDQ